MTFFCGRKYHIQKVEFALRTTESLTSELNKSYGIGGTVFENAQRANIRATE